MISEKEDSSPAIVVGGFVNGLGLVRALSALNRRVIVITTQPYDMAHHSEYVSEHHHVSKLGVRPELLAELLQHHAKDWSGAVVFPTDDEAIAGLSLYHHFCHLYSPPLYSLKDSVDQAGIVPIYAILPGDLGFPREGNGLLFLLRVNLPQGNSKPTVLK